MELGKGLRQAMAWDGLLLAVKLAKAGFRKNAQNTSTEKVFWAF